MKKVLFTVIAFALAAAVSANAQVKQYTHDLTAFSAIEVSNEFEVSVVAGDTYSVVLSVDEPYRDYVSCMVTGNTLSISVDEKKVPADVKKIYKGKGVAKPTFRAAVTLPTAVESVTLHDKAVFFEAKGVMSNEAVSISLTDNAQIKTMDLSATNVNVTLDKKSSANIVANCTNLLVNAAGNANLNIDQNAGVSEFKLQGSCNVSATGTCEEFKLTSKGSAKSTFSGTAKTADYNCEGTSNTNTLMMVCDDANVLMKGSCTLLQAASHNVKLNLSNGATLTYAGTPAFDIESIKSASVNRSK